MNFISFALTMTCVVSKFSLLSVTKIPRYDDGKGRLNKSDLLFKYFPYIKISSLGIETRRIAFIICPEFSKIQLSAKFELSIVNFSNSALEYM